MSKKTKETENANAIDGLNDSLTGISEKVQNNQNIIFIVTGIVAVIVIAILVYIYAFREPSIKAGNEQIGQADYELALGNDSTALSIYKSVADNHGYDAGNRAALQAAILLYQNGEYQQALDYLGKYAAKDNFIGPAAYSLAGDCYVNLDQLNDAEKAFKDAIRESDENPAYTPFFMLKLARVYRALGKYKDEAHVYETIEKDYPLYGQNYNIDIQKYLERARIQAGE
ncbi:MAG: hypothetical protein J1E99_04935 [Muribaculaceae bacterium]|nr:hypothetical protein [Muribaculaceae bacterium]